jgi:methionyl aminopeptidase
MSDKIIIHKAEDFEKMRKAGKIAAEILDFITPYVVEGVTTNQLDKLCHDKIIEKNSIPAPLNYKGFPKSICTSINHVVCHGIPSDKKLVNGDILNIDVTVIFDGWYGDTSRMYFVGEPSVKAKRLCQITYESMMIGIDQIKDGATIGDIGYAIQNYAEKHGFSVVRDYCGHGIGRVFHTDPNVVHYGKKGQGALLKEGMFFTVEPMINAGAYQTILSKHDGWTVTTRDKSLSAQFEHTVGVTKNGVEIFTLSQQGLDFPPYKI